MAYKINEDLYIGNTNKQLKDLLVPDGDTLPIGAIVDFDGSTIPDGYARYVDPDVMSETILFDTNIWDSMMKRYETKNIDFTSYTYVEVHFTGQGGKNATNTILKIDLTKPFKSVITNSSVSYSYGASICFPDIQLLQGSNDDPGIFRIGACISTDKKKIWMGDAGYFTIQTDSGNFDADTKYSRISKIVGFKPTIRIKKTQQPSDYPSNQIHDDYSTSTTDTYSCNYINKARLEEYSTTEKIIGRWIDGKPLYQKVIIHDSGCSSSINNQHAHGIKNVDTIFIKHAFVQNPHGTKPTYMLPITQYGSNTRHDELSVFIDTTYYEFLVQTAWSAANWHIFMIVNYTKTTD